MNKFKFGDKVWHKEYGLCVITGSSPLNAHSIAHNHYARAQLPWFIDEDDITPVTDWVKCSERMPEHDGFYLTIMQDVATNEQWHEIVCLAYGKWSDSWQSTITHWMPLPAPPQD